MSARDAVVVGGGPNGLAAAALLALHDLDVLLVEANERVGGGVSSAPLTLPGFTHDVCSAVHPLAVGSPFLRTLPLERHGLEWIHPDAPLAHPLVGRAGGRAVFLERDVDATAAGLDPEDRQAYVDTVSPLVETWEALIPELLGPARLTRPMLRHPLALARFGLDALRPARSLLQARFRGDAARALLAGCTAHGFLPLERPGSAAAGIVLAAAGHAVGWPLPAGGAGSLAAALEGYCRELGVTFETGRRVRDLGELPDARATLMDVTPRQLLAIAGDRLPALYRRRLENYRYGPGAFKLDWALDGPVPWSDPATARAGTVHLGGPLEAIARSERRPWSGEPPDYPFVLFVQPTLFDPSRAPEGRHVGWAYCHVPHGWEGDATAAVEDQVERYAPGFRDRILARSVRTPADLEAWNANLVGGDINGGVQDLGQLFTRPVVSLDPYRTPVDGVWLCSSSTPPGGGVHGMCGYQSARSALKHAFGLEPSR